jgi:hypothetical protein
MAISNVEPAINVVHCLHWGMIESICAVTIYHVRIWHARHMGCETTHLHLYPIWHARYVGEWHKGKPHGMGERTEANVRSIGEYRSGEMYRGVTTDPAGTYMGDCKDDAPWGMGLQLGLDGATYVGEQSDGWLEGQGAMTYPDGTKYAENWSGSQWHGQGSLTYPDGSTYSGGFVNGQRHGVGVHEDARGEVCVGLWEDDERVQ